MEKPFVLPLMLFDTGFVQMVGLEQMAREYGLDVISFFFFSGAGQNNFWFRLQCATQLCGLVLFSSIIQFSL